jgi:hypothetical protein
VARYFERQMFRGSCASGFCPSNDKNQIEPRTCGITITRAVLRKLLESKLFVVAKHSTRTRFPVIAALTKTLKYNIEIFE